LAARSSDGKLDKSGSERIRHAEQIRQTTFWRYRPSCCLDPPAWLPYAANPSDDSHDMVTDNLRIWIVTAISAVTLALAIVDVAMTSSVRELRADVAQRQQYLNQSVALGRLNTQIIQTLAKLSAQSNDEAIRSLLAKNGVTFKINAPRDDGSQGGAQ
jgi:hypothetical protein